MELPLRLCHTEITSPITRPVEVLIGFGIPTYAIEATAYSRAVAFGHR